MKKDLLTEMQDRISSLEHDKRELKAELAKRKPTTSDWFGSQARENATLREALAAMTEDRNLWRYHCESGGDCPAEVENERLKAELERWRHGAAVEGDFVCPDSLALAEAREALRRLTDRVDPGVKNRDLGITSLVQALKYARAVLAKEGA